MEESAIGARSSSFLDRDASGCVTVCDDSVHHHTLDWTSETCWQLHTGDCSLLLPDHTTSESMIRRCCTYVRILCAPASSSVYQTWIIDATKVTKLLQDQD